jgi:predicted NUDIX family phosphoesterase
LVVPRDVFDAHGEFQGLCFTPGSYLGAFFNPANNLFLARSIAETDPTHKQIIPYAILQQGGKILHYVRGGGSGEKRLVAKESIGIGGHLNEIDQEHIDALAYETLVLRELHEEVDLKGPFTNRVVALLNDDATEVGRVHLGIVHLITLDTSAVVGMREDDVAELQWLSPDELSERADRLESWSRICVESLDRLLVTT